MKLRTKFLLFVVILHLVTLVLSFMIFRENKLFFLLSEILIVVSVIITWNFYNQLIEPLKRLTQGIESMKDRDFNIRLVKTGKQEIDQLIEVYNAMMEQLREERTRQEQQHFFLEKLIATSPTGIVIMDFDEHIRVINTQALSFFRISEEEVLNKKLDDIKHESITVLKSLGVGGSETITIGGIEKYRVQRAEFIDRGFARSFIMIEKLTEEILAAEKKVYGKVIRMMAHEVNNSIGPVNSIILSTLNSENLWTNGNNHTLRNALEVAVTRNNNLNVFTSRLADLVKLPEPVKQRVDLLRLVKSVAQLMELKAREKDISIQFELDADVFFIDADQTQMEQVLINIIKNSIESIGQNGNIQIILENRRLIISDNGKGIAVNHEQHVFSPFFSTKKEGQGIGLTLVREVLRNHGLTFALRSFQGRTDFSIEGF